MTMRRSADPKDLSWGCSMPGASRPWVPRSTAGRQSAASSEVAQCRRVYAGTQIVGEVGSSQPRLWQDDLMLIRKGDAT